MTWYPWDRWSWDQKWQDSESQFLGSAIARGIWSTHSGYFLWCFEAKKHEMQLWIGVSINRTDQTEFLTEVRGGSTHWGSQALFPSAFVLSTRLWTLFIPPLPPLPPASLSNATRGKSFWYSLLIPLLIHCMNSNHFYFTIHFYKTQLNFL